MQERGNWSLEPNEEVRQQNMKRGDARFLGDARSDGRSQTRAIRAGAGHPEPGKFLRRGALDAGFPEGAPRSARE